jgi:hypothetical protein
MLSLSCMTVNARTAAALICSASGGQTLYRQYFFDTSFRLARIMNRGEGSDGEKCFITFTLFSPPPLT